MKQLFATLLQLLLFLCLSSFSQAQHETLHPLSDALEYHKMLKSADNTSDSATKASYLQNAKSILEKYFPESATSKDDEKLKALVFKAITLDTVNALANVSADGESHSLDAASIGAADMIDELAKIIASRFREELTIAFLERFRAKLKTDSLLADVFPNTRRVLLYDDPFNYDSWLSSFRGALHLDLGEIPRHLPEILAGILDRRVITDTTRLNGLRTYLHDIQLLSGFIEHPEQSYKNLDGLLDSISEGASSLISHEGTKKYIGYSQKIVHELSTPDYRNWASEDDFKALTTDTAKLKTFTAFFLHKYRKKFDSIKVNEKSLLSHLSEQKPNNQELKFFKQLIFDAKEVVAQINAIQLAQQNNQEDLIGQYMELTNRSFSMVGDVLGQYGQDSICKNWSKIETALQSITEIQQDIAEQNYTEILPGLLRALDTLVPSEELQQSVFLKEVLKYANLAVSLTTAQTSEEFAAALEGAILPAQSYRLKRSALFSISVNAYAGVFYAEERLLDPQVQALKSGITGFTAPIGLGFNWGITRKNPGKYSQVPVVTKYCKIPGGKSTYVGNKRYYTGHSISLFASVIDVGAVVAFRLQDTVAPSAQVQWKNIIAPGAYVIWGIGKSPLSLQVGAQYGPELRKVEVLDGTTETTINSRAWRFGAALTVDIPLFNVYSKTERVQPKVKKLL